MADITMCANANENGCTLKEQCYRFTAVPDAAEQSYADFEFYANSCNNFWDTAKEDTDEDIGEKLRQLYG